MKNFLLGVGILGAIGSVAVAMMIQQTVPKNSIDWKPAKSSSTETMNAVSYTEHGDVDVLSYGSNYPRPVPSDGQVLIKVMASSVNPVDFKMRRNPVPSWMLPKPKIPGADIAGIIVEIGGGSETEPTRRTSGNFKVGDRVAAMMPLLGSQWGANAEYAVVDTSLIAKVPDSVDFESAAALPLVCLTVIQSLNKIDAHTTKGKKILIHAGAGGVGSFAIQYAKHVLGMYVATTASKEKTNFVQRLGADFVIDYRTTDFTTVVEEYDVVLDTMSFLYETKTLNTNVLKKDGRYLNIMSSDWSLQDGKEKSYGPRTIWNVLRHKVANILSAGILPKYDFCVVVPKGNDLQLAMDLLGNGTIESVIDSVFPLSKLADAHSKLEKGHVSGKIVLQHDTESTE